MSGMAQKERWNLEVHARVMACSLHTSRRQMQGFAAIWGNANASVKAQLTSVSLMDGLEDGGGAAKTVAAHSSAKQGLDGGHHGGRFLWGCLPSPLPWHGHYITVLLQQPTHYESL